MSGTTTVQIAFFLAVEFDKVPQVVLESPNLKGKLSEAETQMIVEMAGRLLGQELVPSDDGEG